MRRLTYGGPAQADLNAINRFLNAEATGQIAADQLERVRTTAKRLWSFLNWGDNPAGGSHRTLRVRGTPFTLFYQVHGQEVIIVRVLHGERDRGSLD